MLWGKLLPVGETACGLSSSCVPGSAPLWAKPPVEQARFAETPLG